MVNEYSPGRAGFRRFICLIALALGLLAVAPASGLANPITTENALTGTPGWEVAQADTPNIDGYTNKTSIAPGESLGFSVSTSPTASYRINIYRLGWYNGAGARLMTCLPSCSTNATGSARTTPNPNAQTGEVDASNNPAGGSWPVSQTLAASASTTWTSGEYVAEYVLKSGTQNGNARYSPFVVRSNAPQASASSILVVVPFNTYDAYNEWGKTSAYVNTTNGSIFPLTNDHAYKVSFNRPFSRREWRFWDINLLRFVEKEGYDVSYVSDTDVDANPQILQQHRAVIVSGHSEYWTQNMRNGFDAARDAGTNLFFAGANDAYWQVRYEDSSCADDNTVCGTVGDRRTMVIYKGPNEGPDDPMPGTANDTSKFRELGRPECELQGGVQYGSWFPNDGYRDYTTTAAGAADPWAAGSSLSNGSTVSGLVGFEYDSFFPDCDVPGTPQILFAYQGPENPDEFDSAAVKYTADGSGARVFSSGSEQWAWGLDSYRWDPTLFTSIPPTNPAVQTFTRNMLTDMQKPASPGGVAATSGGGSIQIDTAPRTDPRITGYKVYRHVGTGSFQPGDAGVTLACQNTTGDCTDTPTPGTYRYASVATDQWNDSSAALSASVSNLSPPTAVNDSATVSEDAAATAVPVTSNDTNPGTDPITISSASDPAHGTVVLTGGTPGANTGLTYQPDPNYCNNPPGTSLDTFTYTINGGSSATVSMTVTCVDDAPVAVHDSKSVIEDDPATAVDVLTNDTDIDGGTKSVASVTQPAHGQVVITGGGTGLTYKPNANYCNFPGPTSDDFTYTLNGGSSTSVSMSVDCRDDPPVAGDDAKTVTEDAAATSIDVLANDTDVEGNTITIAGVTDPAHGTVVLTGGSPGANTGLTYQPDPNYCNNPPGTTLDTFDYTLNGGDTGTVSVTVNCVNDPPVAVNDAATVSEDAASTAIPVLTNDLDPEGDAKTISSNTAPANGTVTLSGGTAGARTNLAYQPNANYCNNPPTIPADTFTYTINGGSTATVSVTVTCVDDPPVAHNDAGSVNEDAPATAVDVLTNDTDIDGGPKTIQSVNTTGTNGAVVITGGGTGLTYQPNANYCNNNGGLADKFTYTLNGGGTGTVTMTVFCVNDSPTAVHDSKSVTEDDPATAVDVLANDTDPEGDPITISSVSDPAHGTVVLTGGSPGARTGLTYQPDANYCNFPGPTSDDFTYTINGGAVGTVSMTVDCVNDPPVASNDSATVTEDAPATAVAVLSNDSDVEGDAISIVSASDPANGTVAITGGGTGLTYKPDANYCNNPPGTSPDTFTYTVNGTSPNKTATVSMTVNCVDDLPVAVNDSKSITEDDPATAVDVLANDTDVDGGTKSIASITQPVHGQAVVTGGGTGLTYKPNADYCNFPSGASDNFTYTLNGGSTGTVSMTVDCVNDAPVAVDDLMTVNEDANATSIDVLDNDTDVEGDDIAITARTQAAHGNVVITGGGTGLTYRPTANYCGPDSFTYTVNGGDTATVSVTVNCIDDLPVAANDSFTVPGNSGATALGVLANDTDIDAGPKEITSVTPAGHGTVTPTGGTTNHWTGLTYQPTNGYCGPDTFTYTLNGGSSATVSITVDCSGDPVAVDDSKTVTEEDPATAIDVLGNDTDSDGGAITISSSTQPANGAVVLTGGSPGARTGLTYKPNANYCNTQAGGNPDTFTYTLNGGATGTVSVTVTCVDDVPVAVNDSDTVPGNSGANSINVLANDTDIDGGPKTIASFTPAGHGTVAGTGGSANAWTGLTYQPTNGYCGPDSFTYQVNGGSSATVSITVDCDGDPIAADDSQTVTEEDPATAIDVLGNDTDSDGGAITITSSNQPANGAVVLTGGSPGARTGLTYKPNANYCNTQTGGSPDSFIYTINGGDTATVSVTVTCVDDAPVAVDDSKSVAEDSTDNSINVLGNDTDVDGGTKVITSFIDPAHGTVSGTGGSANAWTGLSYTPDSNYCNDGSPTDDFDYTVSGGDTATVSVTVDCVDDLPVAVDDGATVTEDAPATAVPVLANDTDIDGGPKSIQSKTDPTHGTVTITGGGTGLTYKPDANYCNDGSPTDNFSYTLNGGGSATVSMTVDCVNDPPEANDDSASLNEDAPATAVPVLSNDTDIEGDAITILSASDPAKGTVVITGGGTGLTYQPDANYCNDPPTDPADTFTYTVNGDSPSKTATVSMTVNCVDDPPTAVNDSPTVSGNAAATPIAVLGNDTDIDGGPKTISSASDPDHGTVVLTGGTAGARTGLTYQPDTGYCRDLPTDPTDDFTYTLNGGSIATVAVTVDCSQPPNAANDNATVPQDAAATPVPVLANDTDVDGGAPMQVLSRTQPANGKVVITGTGTGLTYQPNSGYCNSTTGAFDTFTYTLNGGDSATVFMTVTCAATTQQLVPPPPPAATSKKCKKGFKKVKGKCKKKKRKRK